MLIYTMLWHIQGHNAGGDPATGSPLRIAQIKEKFGALRFYLDGGGYESRRADYRYTWMSLANIRGMIDFAEHYTDFICSSCGSPKGLHETKGWIAYYCQDCAPKVNQETEARVWSFSMTQTR